MFSLSTPRCPSTSPWGWRGKDSINFRAGIVRRMLIGCCSRRPLRKRFSRISCVSEVLRNLKLWGLALLFRLAGLVAIAATVPLLAACSLPAVAPKPPGFQESGIAVRDWDRVAQRIAAALVDRGLLSRQATVLGVPSPVGGPLYIHVTTHGSTFLESVRTSLQTEILARGGTLSRTSANAVVLNLGVEVVQWGSRPRPPGGLGTLVGAGSGAGILLADAAPIGIAGAAGLAVGTGIALDLIKAVTQTETAEAVWTASVVTADRVMLQLREPLYVAGADVALYYGRSTLAAAPSLLPAAMMPARPLRYAP